MKVFIKNRERKPDEFQFFMHQFVESAIKNGISPKKDFPSQKRRVRILKKILSRCKIPSLIKKNEAIIITSSGNGLNYNAFPYYRHEIIPMLWDVWPHTWNNLYKDLKRYNCRIVFVTASYMAEKLAAELGIETYWIPEGIDINDYSKGKDLEYRPIDVYELGRQLESYHLILKNTLSKGQLVGNEYNSDGSLAKLAYPTAQALLENLNRTKIIISFPQTDTHPQRVGNIETLTQRYWEAMLSGCLILGRAPKELIDFIGYNPVIDIKWGNPEKQIVSILNNIKEYQPLVNKNYETARNLASWDLRTRQIKKILSDKGYSF